MVWRALTPYICCADCLRFEPWPQLPNQYHLQNIVVTGFTIKTKLNVIKKPPILLKKSTLKHSQLTVVERRTLKSEPAVLNYSHSLLWVKQCDSPWLIISLNIFTIHQAQYSLALENSGHIWGVWGGNVIALSLPSLSLLHYVHFAMPKYKKVHLFRPSHIPLFL